VDVSQQQRAWLPPLPGRRVGPHSIPYAVPLLTHGSLRRLSDEYAIPVRHEAWGTSRS